MKVIQQTTKYFIFSLVWERRNKISNVFLLDKWSEIVKNMQNFMTEKDKSVLEWRIGIIHISSWIWFISILIYHEISNRKFRNQWINQSQLEDFNHKMYQCSIQRTINNVMNQMSNYDMYQILNVIKEELITDFTLKSKEIWRLILIEEFVVRRCLKYSQTYRLSWTQFYLCAIISEAEEKTINPLIIRENIPLKFEIQDKVNNNS
jgi:hypothetical protein